MSLAPSVKSQMKASLLAHLVRQDSLVTLEIPKEMLPAQLECIHLLEKLHASHAQLDLSALILMGH